ncbi:hypothetical protein FK220_001625 [Flavobacteriaceae bacterium TP-CH-4]|uniref:Uncharacterized protein n=1 Tax=Pelagihabitans pacificus TaxID=2696054 RepID=A0A967E904_9FLAO|nr:hypothetical protein [Pelagihabitans pacificus]NHF58021.1 hypothetical protein [Pelagihabitans pacificus]
MRYTPLFTIEIEHDYFSVSTPEVLRIIPTSATRRTLRGAGLISKFFQNKLYVLIKHLDDTMPFLQLDNDFTLQFFLEVIGPNFSNITNYAPEDPFNIKLYFSNAVSILDGTNKSVENVLYLHEKLPQFNATQAYKYNDLVRSGSDTAYECLQKIDANTGNLNNGSQFRQLEKVSYVSPATTLSFTGPEKIVALTTPATGVTLSYNKYNPVTKDFDIEVKQTTIGPEENPTGAIIKEVLLSFRTEENLPLEEGIYKVILNTTQEIVLYLRPENDWKSYLGLINIHNDAMATEDQYRFLKEDGSFFTVAPANTEIETRNYKIRFAPAQYLLKYKCKTNKVTNITDDDGKIVFDSLGGNIFQSQLPVRMNEKAIDTISIAYDGSDTFQKTKVPGHRNLSILEGDDKYIVSETFLNL